MSVLNVENISKSPVGFCNAKKNMISNIKKRLFRITTDLCSGLRFAMNRCAQECVENGILVEKNS